MRTLFIKNRLVFVIPLLLTVVFSCKESGKKEISPVIQDIEEWVFAPGQIEWDDMYNLTAQTDGILTDANFDIGDTIRKGMVLANIDNRTSVINTGTSREQLAISEENLTSRSPALLQLKENIGFAEEKLKQDQVQAERYERLFKSNSISKTEYENAMLAAKNSKSNVEALRKQYDLLLQQARQQNITARSQVRSNEILQSYNQVIVLQTGIIVKKMKSKGDFVKRGDVIAVAANPEKVEFVLTVDENSIKKVKVGQKAIIRLNTDKTNVVEGKVAEILSAFDVSTQSFICKVLPDSVFPNQQNIYGTPLEANILIGIKKNALLIPREYMGYGNTVRVKGQKENKTIRTGIVSTDFVEVIEGLTEKDVILPLKP